MTTSTSARSLAHTGFPSPNFPIPLPREIIRNFIAPRLASRFRVDELMHLASVSKGFLECCNEWRLPIVAGLRHAEDLRVLALRSADARKRNASNSSRKPGAEISWDNTPQMLGWLCEKYPHLLEGGKSGIWGPMYLLDSVYSGMPAQDENGSSQADELPPSGLRNRSTAPHLDAKALLPGSRSLSPHEALRAFAMLRRFDVGQFCNHAAPLMLMSLCVAVTEGMDDYIEPYGRISTRSVTRFLTRMSGMRWIEDPTSTFHSDFLRFSVKVLDGLPDGAGLHSARLMKHAIAYEDGGPGAITISYSYLGRDWKSPAPDLLKAVLRNLHKLASHVHQGEVFVDWVYRMPVVIPTLCRALARHSSQFPEFAADKLRAGMTLSDFIKRVSHLFEGEQGRRSAFLDLVRSALSSSPLPDPLEVAFVLNQMEGNALISELLGPDSGALEAAAVQDIEPQEAEASDFACGRCECTVS